MAVASFTLINKREIVSVFKYLNIYHGRWMKQNKYIITPSVKPDWRDGARDQGT